MDGLASAAAASAMQRAASGVGSKIGGSVDGGIDPARYARQGRYDDPVASLMRIK